MNKVLMVFRDPARKGNSVEEIYKGLVSHLEPDFDITVFHYNDNLSVKANINRIKKIKHDVIHITSDLYYLLIFLPTSKKIITIHDIGHYSGMKGMKKTWYYWFYIKIPCLLAHRIIVVSGFTKEEIKKRIRLPDYTKIRVIYNPLPEIFKSAELPSGRIAPVILQIGTSPHKNLESIICSLHGTENMLKIIGPLSADQRTRLELMNIIFENYTELTYQEVYKQYVECDMVTFVSLYEGFGMPVIEAQAVGRPVITSKNGAIAEVAGNAAHYIENPLDAVEIAAGINKIWLDEHYRKELISKGFQNIHRFEINKIAEQYREVYSI